MEVKKLGDITDSIWGDLKDGFNFFTGTIYLMLTIFTVFGACASLILLYKMYPDIYLTLSVPMVAVFSFLFIVLKMVVSILVILMCLYIVFATMHIFKDQSERNKKKRETDRKKFMNELKKELSKK